MNLANYNNIFRAFTMLDDYGMLKIAGLDAKKFLQGQLTCNLEKVNEHTNTLGAHCNPEGRVISLFYVCYFQQAYHLVMPRALISLTAAALKKYAVFSKVTITDVSDSFNIVGGVNTDVAALFYIKLINISSKIHKRYLIIFDRQNTEAISKQFDNQYKIISPLHWHLLDIDDGIPAIYSETSAKFLPHEINLIFLNAISFDKGCFTGQEIIARMHYRGKLKKRLYWAKITIETNQPLPGNDIYRQEGHDTIRVGVVVDAAHQSNGEYHILMILDDANAKNNDLFLKNDPHHYFFEIK